MYFIKIVLLLGFYLSESWALECNDIGVLPCEIGYTGYTQAWCEGRLSTKPTHEPSRDPTYPNYYISCNLNGACQKCQPGLFYSNKCRKCMENLADELNDCNENITTTATPTTLTTTTTTPTTTTTTTPTTTTAPPTTTTTTPTTTTSTTPTTTTTSEATPSVNPCSKENVYQACEEICINRVYQFMRNPADAQVYCWCMPPPFTTACMPCPIGTTFQAATTQCL